MASDLPPDYIEFAKQLGFSSPEQWDVTRGNLKDGWKRIHRRIATGRSLRGTVRDFIARMNSSDDHFRRKSGEVGVTRVTPVSAQIQLFDDLYPQFAPYVTPQTSVGSEYRIKKQKAPEVRKPKVKTPMFVQIGFGLESTFRPRKIERDSVILDEHTTPMEKASKSIIYVPGWSLSGSQGDSDQS